VERRARASLAAFFAADQPLAAGATIALGEEAAHHMRVRRLGVGERLAVLDGNGMRAEGTLVRLAKDVAHVTLDSLAVIDPLPPVHLLVPIADRERMLWLAEKSVELGATSWRPVMWRRSRSVSPKGEGTSFAQKVRARMVSALAQSGGAWLPAIYPDATPDRAIAAAPEGTRLVLEADAVHIGAEPIAGLVTIAVGPEGGFEPPELTMLREADFRAVSLPTNILRFETAVIGALAIARVALGPAPAATHEP
jgi:16S rRNA (uracil1498-N3)-methyltransferase